MGFFLLSTQIEKMMALSSDFIASFDTLIVFYDLWVLLDWL
jgi:hypothetical protein